MKKPIFTLFLSLCFISLFAQRVDLDRFNFTVAYRTFPEDPLPEAYKTYNVRVETAPSVYTSNNLDALIDIEGLKKVPGTGHITVLAMLDDIQFEKSETKERIDVKKDKQGNEIKKSYFSVEETYSFSARATVYDYRGNTLASNIRLSDRNSKKTYHTPEFSSAEDAVNAFNSKIAEVQRNLGQQLATQAISSLNNILNSKYGYTVQKTNDILWILNNKRHAEYHQAQKAWNDFRNAIVLMDANEPLDKVREKMKPVIDYFEKAKNRFTTSSKEDRKLRYASYFNLAKIYLYLDEPEKAMREADALAMNDYDERDGKYLRAMAENLEETFRKNNTTTRHFNLDVASYDPPVK